MSKPRPKQNVTITLCVCWAPISIALYNGSLSESTLSKYGLFIYVFIYLFIQVILQTSFALILTTKWGYSGIG